MTGAGYSGTPLAKKLGIKEGHRVAMVGAPAHMERLLDLPVGVRLTRRARKAASQDVVIAFARRLSDLRKGFSRGRALMHVDGGMWICWPKQSSPLATTMKEGDVRAHGLAEGLVDNKICAVDDDWSALRFVYRLEDRARLRA